MKALEGLVVTEIREAMLVPFEKGNVSEMKERSCYGIAFCTDGQLTYAQNQKQYVFTPGSAVIFPQGKSYTIYADKAGVFPVINFRCAGVLCEEITLLSVENMELFLRDFEQIKQLHFFGRNHAKIFGIFYQMIDRLLTAGSSENNLLMPAIRYLEQNYSDSELTNVMLAKQCNISEVYFRKLFFKWYGTTPRQFVIDTRIQKAKQLLTDGVRKINVVSGMCGFSNPYHFCRLFKERTGFTPTEYMMKHRTNKI